MLQAVSNGRERAVLVITDSVQFILSQQDLSLALHVVPLREERAGEGCHQVSNPESAED